MSLVMAMITKITFIVTEIFFKVAVVTFSVAKKFL